MKRKKTRNALPKSDNFFTIKRANDWLKSSSKTVTPGKLFGDFWLEGELAIMFADTGKGKSLLAVQIAESIAAGSPIEPFNKIAEPQKVVYLDFELTEKQFEMRYGREIDADDVTGDHYEFSDNFTRVEIDLTAKIPGEYASYDDYLHTRIEQLMIQTKAKVLIVDNLTYLKRSNESTREALPLMNTLNRLKKQLGLSILVLAHSPKRETFRGISVNDLQGSKVLSNFADNIFAIGQNRIIASARYIKHIKPRCTELIYDSTHVPVYTIEKMGAFLGFRFNGFSSEADNLVEQRVENERRQINRIKRLHDEGYTVREIGDMLSMAKSSVHRRLTIWEPLLDPHRRPPPQKLPSLENEGSPGFAGREVVRSEKFPVSLEIKAELQPVESNVSQSTTPPAEAASTPPVEERSLELPTRHNPVKRNGEKFWFEYDPRGRRIRWETRKKLNRTPVGIILEHGQTDPIVPLAEITIKDRPTELYEYGKDGSMKYVVAKHGARFYEYITLDTMPQARPPMAAN